MIVDGDQSHSVEIGVRASHLSERTRRTIDMLFDGGSPFDTVRALLILAGQLEQALADLGDDDPDPMILGAVRQAEEITERAARALYAVYRAPRARLNREVIGELRAMQQELEQLIPLSLSAKMVVPEGFASHGLFPEQYFMAAERWLAEPRPASKLGDLVVGARSIGTSLSAAVCAVLNYHCRATRRITLKPHGHLYDRHVDLPGDLKVEDRLTLIVGDGPGISGSSMAAIAQALEERGARKEAISIFPGARGEPRRGAPESVEAWWRAARPYTASVEEIRFGDSSLEESLMDTMAAGGQACIRSESLGAGLWRQFAIGKEEGEWPAVCVRLERPKLLLTAESGERFVLKFFGHAWAREDDLSAEELALSAMRDVARRGYGAQPIGAVHGFVVAPWIEGRPLARKERSRETLEAIAAYITSSIGPRMDRESLDRSIARAGLIIRTHGAAAVGPSDRARFEAFAATLGSKIDDRERDVAQSRDGSCVPHAFIRTADNRLMKTCASGRGCGPFSQGVQPVDWDVAALLVEWGLFEREAVELLDLLKGLDARARVPEASLAFHRLAYASLRLGELHLALEDGEDGAEEARARAELAFYEADIRRTIGAPGKE
jgi:hypothetical protein